MADVLVGIDGSGVSAGAFARGLDEAERRGVPVRALHVWETPMWVGGVPGLSYDLTPSREESESWARTVVDEVVDKVVADRPSPPAVPVEREIRHGVAHRELLTASHDSDLLVVGGRGHGHVASALLGSVTNELLHSAACPVMLVPEPTLPVVPWARVVVGLDGSRNSHQALSWAAEIARRDQVPLVVVHAWLLTTLPSRPPMAYIPPLWEYGAEAETWLRHEVERHLPDQEGIEIRQAAVHSAASAALLEITAPEDLLVLGARGRGGFGGLLLGSVAAQCARHANGALVVVRERPPT
jgi:nucleotide-binding universal stress UspA family protein